MKIAFYLGTLNRGGAETLVLDVCNMRKNAPFQMCCIYRNDGTYSESFRQSGADLLKLEKRKSLLLYMLRLRRMVLSNHIDIVHAQTPSNAMICVLALAFTKVKLVTTFHGFTFSDSKKIFRNIVYRNSKKIICVSEYEKHYYEGKWNLPIDNKISVVYNGIDYSKLDRLTKTVDNELMLPEKNLNMMMVGSFVSVRSQLFVCHVLAELYKKQIPFDFFFVGRKDDAESRYYNDCVSYCMQNGLMDCVHFLGVRTDVPELLKKMDLFLYASNSDTFGIAVLEALAAGVPVIVNDWVVMKEITENGKYAELYKTDDVNDCMEKIIRFIENKNNNVDELSERNRTVAAEIRRKYSIENHIKKLNDIYLSCLK